MTSDLTATTADAPGGVAEAAVSPVISLRGVVKKYGDKPSNERSFLNAATRMEKADYAAWVEDLVGRYSA